MSPPPHEIRAETRALQRLARALVHDDATAADLVQDTWVAAIAQPPDLDRPLRPWLARVLFNRAVSTRRSSERADARARRVAETLSAIAATDPERAQAVRQLLEEVAALPEADQALLHARFWDGCNATECAQRLDRPASTVRTQLARALARLRKRLDARAGDREAWVAGLVPWIAATPEPAWLGGALRPLGLAIGTGAVVSAMVMLSPNGCGAAVLDGSHEAPLDAAAREPARGSASSRREIAGAAVPPERRPAPTPATRQTREAPTFDHPKLSVHATMQHIDDIVGPCRSGKEDAMLRVQPIIVFTEDDPPFVETVDVRYQENLSDDELECMRENLIALDIAPATIDPSMKTPWRYTPTYELYFDEHGVTLGHAVSRGPLMSLATRTRDGSDIRDALAACAHAGTYRTRLTFDALTGALVDVSPDPSASASTQRCAERAIRGAIIKGVPFEPRAPEDASLACTFALGSDPAPHNCVRLGPDGTYVEAPPA